MSNIKPLSHCSEIETAEFLFESLKQGADIARQLARLQGKQKWVSVAQILEKIHHKGQQLATGKSLSRFDALFLLDQEQKKLNDEQKKTVN